MAEDPNFHPRWVAETKAIAAALPRLDYFQVLGATPQSSLEELKARYHQLQRNYHPDSFYTSPDAELRDAVHAIAKRVAEAYVVLRDPRRRAKYTQDVTGPHRAERLRFTEDSDREVREEQQVGVGKTPQVRSLWSKATAALRSGDFAAAERDLKTALIFEPGHPKLEALLAEARAKAQGEG